MWGSKTLENNDWSLGDRPHQDVCLSLSYAPFLIIRSLVNVGGQQIDVSEWRLNLEWKGCVVIETEEWEIHEGDYIFIQEFKITPLSDGGVDIEAHRVSWFDVERKGVYKVSDFEGLIAQVTLESFSVFLTDEEEKHNEKMMAFRQEANEISDLIVSVLIKKGGWGEETSRQYMMELDRRIFEESEEDGQYPDVGDIAMLSEAYLEIIREYFECITEGQVLQRGH